MGFFYLPDLDPNADLSKIWTPDIGRLEKSDLQTSSKC